ncbi:hypothetical protein ACLOJK_019622 [Asimina triloba]
MLSVLSVWMMILSCEQPTSNHKDYGNTQLWHDQCSPLPNSPAFAFIKHSNSNKKKRLSGNGFSRVRWWYIKWVMIVPSLLPASVSATYDNFDVDAIGRVVRRPLEDNARQNERVERDFSCVFFAPIVDSVLDRCLFFSPSQFLIVVSLSSSSSRTLRTRLEKEETKLIVHRWSAASTISNNRSQIHLGIMFLLIVLPFRFIVTYKGVDKAVSSQGYKECCLSDYSHWLYNKVIDNKNWRKIKSYLSDIVGDQSYKIAVDIYI